jgi:hypothetical protein
MRLKKFHDWPFRVNHLLVGIILLGGILSLSPSAFTSKPICPDKPVISIPSASKEAEKVIRFAVIGDFGQAGSNEAAVASLVKSWQPDFIITTGDNNYPNGEATTIDANIGQYFSDYIFPYDGSYSPGTDTNRFFPSLGNHDWESGTVQPYLDYFPIDESVVNLNSSGNERYYDFMQGPVHFFVLDSNRKEPDGTTSTSRQASWLQAQLAASTTPWQVVYFHHPPYSSSKHGSLERMQWPFAHWGADIVLSGHDHTYERLHIDDILYFVNGLGGRSTYPFYTPVAGSQVRYNENYGAMLVAASEDYFNAEFYSITCDGELIDSYTIEADREAAGAVTVSPSLETQPHGGNLTIE